MNNYGEKQSLKDYKHIPEGWNTWYALVGERYEERKKEGEHVANHSYNNLSLL